MTMKRPTEARYYGTALLCLSLAACGGKGDPAGAGSSGAGARESKTPDAPWFEEVGAASGIDFVHASGATGEFLMPEIMTTGAALFDANGDGHLDAYLVQGGAVRTPRKDRSPNRFYLGNGDGTFTDATESSGAGDRGYGMGVSTGDYDGDGDVDLYVSNLERNTLLQNDGEGHFTDVTEASGTGSTAWSASSAFLDYDDDGDLDLFVTNYIEWSADAEKACLSPRRTRTYCSPKSYGHPAKDQIFQNQGDGTFVDVSEGAGLDAAFGNGLGVVCADFDLDGLPEIFVANDGTPNQYWDPSPTGRWSDIALGAGCAVDTQGRAKAGMGVAAADVDADGDEDLLVVNLTGEDDSFYRNDNGKFVDRTPAVGLAVVSRRRTRFGVALRDLNLDGLFDLYHANGRVTEPARAMEGDPFAEENVLMRGLPNGRFEEVTPRAGLANPVSATSRAAAFGDIDGDGDEDILIHNRDGRAHVMKNLSADGGARSTSIEVCHGNGSPAIGAWVLITMGDRTVRREIRTTDSYCAASSPILHVGLGDAKKVDRIEVFYGGESAMVIEGASPGPQRFTLERAR